MMSDAHFRVALSRVPKDQPAPRVCVIRTRRELDAFAAYPVESETRRPKVARLGQVSLKDVLPALDYLDGLAPEDRLQIVRDDRWLGQLAAKRLQLVHQVPGAVRSAAAHQAKLDPVRHHLERRLDSAKARSACEHWLSGATEGYLDVTRDSDLMFWIEYLASVGVPASRIALRMPKPDPELVSITNDLVAMALSCRLALDGTDGDQGLPARYLLISSRVLDGDASAPSAQMSMAGFHALFLSANVALRMRT